MMEKRYIKAQTTIFIIIAVLVVAIVIGFIYLKSSTEKEERGRDYFKQHKIEPSLDNIQDFIVECLEETSIEALEVIGIQGGYYNQPDHFYDLEWSFIPYFYYKGEFLMPDKTEIETQLSDYINTNLPECTKEINFKNFQLEYPEPQTTTLIKSTEVTFTTDLQVTIKQKESSSTFELESHPVSISSSLNDIIEVAGYITDSHKDNEDLICINCLAEMAKEKDLYIDFIAFEEDSTLVMILENSTAPDPYLFEFLNKYEV